MKPNLKTTLIGGLIATTAMTMIMLMAPMMGMPEMPIGKMLADFMHLPVFFGWTIHFMIGLIFAFIYSILPGKILPNQNLIRGILFSTIPFLMAQLMIMPMMGMGIFTSGAGEMQMKLVFGSLIGHLIYGIALGLTIKKLRPEYSHECKC